MNLEKLLAENILRFNTKNINESTISKIKLLAEQAEPKTLEKQINFASGKWSATAGNVNGILNPSMGEIEQFLRDNGASSKLVTIILEASESYVPNYDTEVKPKQPLKPRELSNRRYETIETYMKTKLAQWQKTGLIPTDPAPKIEKLEPKIGGPKWSPPAGATKEQIEQLVNSKQYTDHQYLRMFIKVTAETATSEFEIPEVESAMAQVETNREPIATNKGNEPFFFSYSRAAAAMLGVDYKTLPSQLLTMNRFFVNKTPVTLGNIHIPAVTIKIIPEGGTDVKLVVNNGGAALGPRDADGGGGKDHMAHIAKSYKLELLNIKPGTPEYKGAWLFAFWYCTGTSQLNDWDFISNKPKDIIFPDKLAITRRKIDKIYQTPEGQEEYFKPLGPFIKGLAADKLIVSWEVNSKNTFEKLYKQVCDASLTQHAEIDAKRKAEEEAENSGE